MVWEDDYALGNNGMMPRGQKYAVDYFDQEILLGDLNEDTILNILDVIILVNIALSNIDFDSSNGLIASFLGGKLFSELRFELDSPINT